LDDAFLAPCELQVKEVELVQTDLVAGLLPRLAGAVDLLVSVQVPLHAVHA
jgi:hypothetical protein